MKEKVYGPDGNLLGEAIVGTPEYKDLCEEKNELCREMAELFMND